MKTKKVYESNRDRRLFVVMTEEEGRFRLTDKDGNVYWNGSPEKIEKHIDGMIKKKSYYTK